MSHDKEDFMIMTDISGAEVIVNIPRIKFIVTDGEICHLFFDAGKENCLTVKYTIDEFMEIL